MATLKNKTILVTGASRGIGHAIALRAARDGANIVIAAKTTEPHPKLDGTIYTAAEDMEAAGGSALAVPCDVRFEEQIEHVFAEADARFGGVDIVVSNASAISLTPTEDTTAKRYDLMHQVNTRATFLCAKHAIPRLKRAENPHFLSLSPPVPAAIQSRWFAPHLAYTLSKVGMSLCVLGLAEELKEHGIAVNALWPRTTIATAAIQNLLGGDALMRRSRKPAIMADAAHRILTTPSRELTGQFLIDDDVLRAAGVDNLSHYAVDPDAELQEDFFL